MVVVIDEPLCWTGVDVRTGTMHAYTWYLMCFDDHCIFPLVLLLELL